MLAAPTVLFDGTIPNAPAFATYAVVNAVNLQCNLGYTNHRADGGGGGAGYAERIDGQQFEDHRRKN